MTLLFGGGNAVSFMLATDDGTAFTEQYDNLYIFSQRSTMADIDNDGNLDAFVCHDVDQSHAYRNDGSGTMILDQSLIVTEDSPGNYSAIWVDYDNDGDSDLFVTKCIFGSGDPTDPNRVNKMYRNEGNGTYTEVGEEVNLADNAQSWTTVFEDFDNDGDFDAFVVNHDFDNRLMINDNGVFTDAFASTGLTSDLGSWEGVGGDFNNDGFVDIIGQFGQSLYINNGDLTFTPQSAPFQDGGIGDFNNDGFLDAVKGTTIHYNDGNDNNWVKINTEGIFSNKNGIGARVEIHGSWGIQIREVRSGTSFSPMSSLTVHFGIGQAESIDEIVIKWPSGIITNVENPAINTTHNLIEANCLLGESTLTLQGAANFCEGQSTILEAPTGYDSYQWSNGQTGSSITVTESGNYKVVSTDANGCVSVSNIVTISVTDEIDPIISIVGDDLVCLGDPITITAENGENHIWSNGMTGQTIEVTQPGPYSVSVDAICNAGQITSESIIATMLEVTNPVAEDVQISAPGPATFTATGDNIEWYDSPTADDPIAIGPTYTLDPVTAATSVYVQANAIDGGEVQTGGKEIGGGGGLPGSGAYNYFNVWEEFTLQNVTVEAFTPGTRTIQLHDESGQMLEQVIVDLEAGVQQIELDWWIPLGEQMSIRCLENNLFRNDGGVDYPYSIGDVGTMTGSFYGPQFYYYFYDWNIEKKKVACASDRLEVTASIVSSTNDLDGTLNELQVTPNPASDFVLIQFNSDKNTELFISLFDATGKEVMTTEKLNTQNGVNQTNLDVSHLPKGMYYLQFNANGMNSGHKIVVQ